MPFKTEIPVDKYDDSFEGRSRFNPESPNAFIKILNTNPNLIANAARELHKKNFSLYSICRRVTHPSIVKQMFLNSELIDHIALEGKKLALMQKFARILKLE